MEFTHSVKLAGGRATLQGAYSRITAESRDYEKGTVTVTYRTWAEASAAAKKLVPKTREVSPEYDPQDEEHVRQFQARTLMGRDPAEIDGEVPWRPSVVETYEDWEGAYEEEPIGNPVVVEIASHLSAQILAGEISAAQALLAQLSMPAESPGNRQLLEDLDDAVPHSK